MFECFCSSHWSRLGANTAPAIRWIENLSMSGYEQVSGAAAPSTTCSHVWYIVLHSTLVALFGASIGVFAALPLDERKIPMTLNYPRGSGLDPIGSPHVTVEYTLELSVLLYLTAAVMFVCHTADLVLLFFPQHVLLDETPSSAAGVWESSVTYAWLTKSRGPMRWLTMALSWTFTAVISASLSGVYNILLLFLIGAAQPIGAGVFAAIEWINDTSASAAARTAQSTSKRVGQCACVILVVCAMLSLVAPWTVIAFYHLARVNSSTASSGIAFWITLLSNVAVFVLFIVHTFTTSVPYSAIDGVSRYLDSITTLIVTWAIFVEFYVTDN